MWLVLAVSISVRSQRLFCTAYIQSYSHLGGTLLSTVQSLEVVRILKVENVHTSSMIEGGGTCVWRLSVSQGVCY